MKKFFIPSLIKIFCIAFILLGSMQSAFAYVGPGVGSILVQLLFGGVAGVIVVLKLFWHKLFKSKSQKEPLKEEQESPLDLDNNDHQS